MSGSGGVAALLIGDASVALSDDQAEPASSVGRNAVKGADHV